MKERTHRFSVYGMEDPLKVKAKTREEAAYILLNEKYDHYSGNTLVISRCSFFRFDFRFFIRQNIEFVFCNFERCLFNDMSLDNSSFNYCRLVENQMFRFRMNDSFIKHSTIHSEYFDDSELEECTLSFSELVIYDSKNFKINLLDSDNSLIYTENCSEYDITGDIVNVKQEHY